MGQLLFTIFIDDINGEILCEISKFAEDTKISNCINILNDIRLMQNTLDKLVAWINGWEMDFNISKWGIMHIRKGNLEFQYQMNDGWIKSIDEERDFKVLCLRAWNSQNNVYWKKIKLI